MVTGVAILTVVFRAFPQYRQQWCLDYAKTASFQIFPIDQPSYHTTLYNLDTDGAAK
jgi:hypothetical protein